MLAKYLIALTSLTATVLGALDISTPLGVVVCQPVPIIWSGGTGPYRLSVIPGGQLNAAPLKDFGELAAQISVYTWAVDIPAGTLITLKLADSNGEIAYSVPFTPKAGKSDACLQEALSRVYVLLSIWCTRLMRSVLSVDRCSSPVPSPPSQGCKARSKKREV